MKIIKKKIRGQYKFFLLEGQIKKTNNFNKRGKSKE
jgi:hypothetical protein